ncbi:MAG: hypothetical protein DRN24_01040 [Thermoplasmata archaeon]|nr:MAG: hypothetical protein DRN24_01040 [Thermoplasmata archaeon]
MKKIFEISAVIGVLLFLIPTAAIAYPMDKLYSDANTYNIDTSYRISDKGQTLPVNDYSLLKPVRVRTTCANQIHKQKTYLSGGYPIVDVPPRKSILLKGIWGYAGDNESDGYLIGKIIRNHRAGVFRGFYNTTNNETRGRIFGVMKHGYFNGRVVTPDGENCRIVGIYKINKEDRSFKLRWMTPHKTGWAIAKILKL